MVHPLAGKRGPARTLFELAQYLAVRWDVLVAAPEGFLTKNLRDVELLRLPLVPSRARSWWRGRSAIGSALRRERRDVLVHANGLSALNLVALAARRLGAPVLVHFHDSELRLRSRLMLKMWKGLGVRMTFFPVSDLSDRLLRSASIRPLVRSKLVNPIRCRDYEVSRDGVRSPFRVGFVGSRSPAKGLHTVVDMAKLMTDDDVEWHLFGIHPDRHPGEYVGRCAKRISDLGLDQKIVWRGSFTEPRPAYASVDALLVPSERESFCRVALEGMASGLPVVAARIPGLSELVIDETSGLLFDPRRPQEAADRLRRIVVDDELRVRLSAGAKEGAQAFDISTVGRSLEGFYKEMLEGPVNHNTVSA